MHQIHVYCGKWCIYMWIYIYIPYIELFPLSKIMQLDGQWWCSTARPLPKNPDLVTPLISGLFVSSFYGGAVLFLPNYTITKRRKKRIRKNKERQQKEKQEIMLIVDSLPQAKHKNMSSICFLFPLFCLNTHHSWRIQCSVCLRGIVWSSLRECFSNDHTRLDKKRLRWLPGLKESSGFV